jgi:hypothetical protein
VSDHGPRFWIGVVVGWAIIAFGVHSAFRTSGQSNPDHSVIPLILFALANDLLLAPLVIVIGLGLRRIVRPGPVVGPTVAAALISVLVTAFTWPEIRHYGKDPALASSLQTLDYATGLLTVIGVVWLSAAVVAVSRVVWIRRHRPAAPRP